MFFWFFVLLFGLYIFFELIKQLIEWVNLKFLISLSLSPLYFLAYTVGFSIEFPSITYPIPHSPTSQLVRLESFPRRGCDAM